MRQRVLLAVLIVTAALAGIWTAALHRIPTLSTGQPAEPPPALAIVSEGLDLGEVWEERAFKRTVRVENRSGEPVRVEEISCGCVGLSVSPNRFELAPGAAQDIVVTIDLSTQHQNGADSRPFTAPLRLQYLAPGGSTSSQALGEFRGTVKPVLITKPVWNLGACSKASGPIQSSFRVVSTIPVASIEADVPSNPWGLQVSVKKRTDLPEAYDVLVRSEEPCVLGSLKVEVALRPRTSDGSAVPPKYVTVEAETSATDLRVFPPELYFGGTRTGTAAESVVTLASISGREVRVERVEPSGPDVVVSPTGNPNEFLVTQRVRSVGGVSGSVWFTARTNDGVERVQLAVNAVGVEPTAP